MGKRNKSSLGTAHTICCGPDDGAPVNFPLLLMNTLSHYYYFLHHVCRPVSYRHGGWQQKHSGPITRGPPVISSSCFPIINIILTYFSDAPNSSEVKQCALSVPGYKHSVTQKKINKWTAENNLIFKDGRMIPVA